MMHYNPKTSLSEVLIFLLVLASGLSYLNPIFAVSVGAVACLFAVVHLAQHETLRQQKVELELAKTAYDNSFKAFETALDQTEKLSKQVADMQEQIAALRSANAIAFGGRK